jgi:hypothetical protein
MMRLFDRRHRTARWITCSMGLALAAVCAHPRPAHAALPIATVTAVVELVGTVGESLSKWEWLFAGNGPEISNELNAVKVAIINELRTQRNQEWRANVQSVFDNFAILGFRSRHISNEPLRQTTWNLSQGAFNHYSIIVEDGTDRTSSLELAPMFTVLTGVHTGLTKMKAELDPSHPAPWGEYDIYLKRAMQVNDRLVGSSVAGCWPGFNPGKGKYNVIGAGPDELNAGSVLGNWDKSQLWRKLLTSAVTVPQSFSSVVRSACFRTITLPNGHPQYVGPCAAGSLTQLACWGPSLVRGAVPSCSCTGPGQLDPSTSCGQAVAGAAKAIANQSGGVFGGNGAVKIVRAGMRSIMSMGGGDDRWDGPTIPSSGALTDPWLNESACGPFGPWSYVSTP